MQPSADIRQPSPQSGRRPLYLNPFAQVVCAIALGMLLGFVDPELAQRMKPLGEFFIQTIKLFVGPIVFLTVASGIAALGNVRQVGRVGVKALIYFELLSTLALIVGLAAAHFLQPGAGFHLDPATTASIPPPPLGTDPQNLWQTLVGAFMDSSILQVLVLAILCGIALALMGARAARLTAAGDWLADWLFKLVKLILKAAPLAAFGAIAFTVGKFGLVSVLPLLKLLGALYLTTFLFVALALGLVARCSGFRLLGFLRYIKEELLLVFATASSVSAMPGLIDKLKHAGCAKSVVGVVVPAGYTFNLNGSNIYLGLALVFLAQALRIELGFSHYLTILAVAMVTSKGASGVAGSAFIALAATISAVPGIPDSSLAFIVGIERMLKCRSLGNLIGNGVACLAIAAWDGKLDRSKLRDCGFAVGRT